MQQTKSGLRVQGWLFFSSTKQDVRFVPHSAQTFADLPWEIFCEEDTLLARFLKDFGIRREKDPKVGFCYEIDCEYEAVDRWLRANVEVIEVEDDD
jgi:hypothetical protein